MAVPKEEPIPWASVAPICKRVYKDPISRTTEMPSGWPTSFRGGGHDDPPGNVGPCRLMQPPRSENVGHPQHDSALFIHALNRWGALPAAIDQNGDSYELTEERT